MGSVDVRPIGADSVLLEPTGPSEACGVQDPRISYNPADGTYYMTYCVYGPPLPKDPNTNPHGIKCGGAGTATSTSLLTRISRLRPARAVCRIILRAEGGGRGLIGAWNPML